MAKLNRAMRRASLQQAYRLAQTNKGSESISLQSSTTSTPDTTPESQSVPSGHNSETDAEPALGEVQRPGLWRSIFGLDTLLRWDVLGALVPGIFITVGLAMLGVEWFPNNLLVSQLCFSVAALMIIAKTIGHASTTKGTLFSKAVFCAVLCGLTLAVALPTLRSIQSHKVRSLETRRKDTPPTPVDVNVIPSPPVPSQPREAKHESKQPTVSRVVSEELIKKWLERFQINVTPTPTDPRVDFRFEVTMPDNHRIAIAMLKDLPGYIMLSATLRTDPGTQEVLNRFSAEQLLELRNVLIYELSKGDIPSNLTTKTSNFDNLLIYKRIAITGLTEAMFIEYLDALDRTVTHVTSFMALRMHEIDKSIRHP